MAKPVGKESIIAALETLPEDAVQELATFIEFLQFKAVQKESHSRPYRPLKLGGVWEGVVLDEDDFREMRREMWQTLGDES